MVETADSRTQASADREAALAAYSQAAGLETAMPSLRIGAARVAAALAAKSEPGRAAALLEAAVQLERHIPLPATAQLIGPENVALLHTSFRSPKADERFRDGRRYYQFEVIVVAPDSVMDKINSVTYHLERAWPEAKRTQVIRDRSSRFKMKELANGTSIVTAAIEIEGQTQPLKLNRFIDLRPDGPRL